MAGKRLNWKYIALRLVRRHLPDRLFFVLMKLAGLENTSESSPEEAWKDWQTYLHRQGIRVENAHICELGSGRYARLAVQMIAAGARRVSLIDPFAVPLEDPSHRLLLAADCDRLHLALEDVLTRIQVYRADFLEIPIPSDCADLVMSKSVLEHLHDPAQILQRSHAWLVPGGVSVHLVDLRDHYFSYPFEMLTFASSTWERWLNPQGGFHLNRWRLPQYLDAMKQSGFDAVYYEVSLRDWVGLQAIAPRLAPEFRTFDQDTLAVLMMYLQGIRR